MKRRSLLPLTVLTFLLCNCVAAEKKPAETPAGPGGGAFKPGADTEKAPTTPDEAQQQFDQRWEAFQAAGNDCVTLCKALSSMKRAAEHICQMAESGGDADKKRCSDAQDKVATASKKVKETCGGC